MNKLAQDKTDAKTKKKEKHSATQGMYSFGLKTLIKYFSNNTYDIILLCLDKLMCMSHFSIKYNNKLRSILFLNHRNM